MEANKKIALRALTGAFVDRDPSVVEQYFTPDYIQHNPTIPSGPGCDKGFDPKIAQRLFLRAWHGGGRRRSGDGPRALRWLGAEADGRRRYISSGGRQGGRALGCNARGSSYVGLR